MVLSPSWPTPLGIKALSTDRRGGCSEGPYMSANYGLHVGDEEQRVLQNRKKLGGSYGVQGQPVWLDQVHGNQVLKIEEPGSGQGSKADASYTALSNQPCVIMTADCLPLLVCDRKGTEVAAIHGGWRSLAAGIIENTLACFKAKPRDLYVWLGPAIGPSHFEVGSDVFEAFEAKDKHLTSTFQRQEGEKFLCDIFRLATLILQHTGVEHIFCEQLCTYSQAERFYSYRRDGITGRMASLIWISA